MGAVVSASEVLAYVVPEADDLVVEARVRPIDIENVRVGGHANIRFTSFNLRTTHNAQRADVAGKVVSLSPDQIVDERSGETYFRARVATNEDERAKLGDNVIVAGMPAAVLIVIRQRKVIDYIVKPLSDQINRAFRKD